MLISHRYHFTVSSKVTRWVDQEGISIHKWVSGKSVSAEISSVQENWSNIIVFSGMDKLQEDNSWLPRGSSKILCLSSSLFRPVQQFGKGKWMSVSAAPWHGKNNRINVCVCKEYRIFLGTIRTAAKHPLYTVRFQNHLQSSLWLFLLLLVITPYQCEKFLLLKLSMWLSHQSKIKLGCWPRITAFNWKGK